MLLICGKVGIESVITIAMLHYMHIRSLSKSNVKVIINLINSFGLVHTRFHFRPGPKLT